MKQTRKLLSYLLAVCLILSSVSMAIMAFANEVTADVTINSAAELSAFAAEANAGNTFSGKTVVLNADIDLGGITWTPINKFAGKFYGNNHTIRNFQIDATAAHGGFFNVLSWGLVEDLKLTDITATVGNYRFGTLARSVEGTNINNITVKNVVVTTTHGGAFVAGLICHGTVNSQVTMNDCTVENLTVNAEAGAMLIGGITTFVQKNGTEAEGTNIFDNLQVKNFNVTVNGADDFTAVGGLVGQTQSVWQNPRFNNCSVTGLDVTATGKVDVGGFMCYPGSYTYAENCTVEGKIDVTGVTSADNFAGGFFGDYGWGDNVGKGDHMVTNCVADVDVTTQIATAGGFVGSGTNSENKNKNITLTNCTVKGTVTRVEGGTATIGGFVGEADRGHYINCFAVSEPWIGAKLSENIVIENYVAKVGDTKYETIDEAIAAWTHGTTLTLLADVTLTDVIKLSSTEYHVLDLGTYTMTAASKKDAIQIVNNGRSSASYALDIKADATNPGGITATGKAVVVTTGKSGVKDRPIIRFYNGVFTGNNVVKHSGSNGTNCPQFQFHGGVFNGTVFTNRSMNLFYGGTFNGSLMMSVDSSAYALVSGGTFKQLSNLYNSTLNSGKFTIGSAKGVYDKEVYVNDDGYYVVAAAAPAEGYEASVPKNPGTNDYLAYSKVKTDGVLNYTSAIWALKNNKTAKVTVYFETLDLAGVDFTGTIVVPEGNELTIINAPEDLKVEGNAKIVRKVAQIGETKYESLKDAIDNAVAGDTIVLIANVEEDVTVNKAVTIDGAGKTYTGQMTLTANVTVKNVNFDGKGYNGYAIVTKSAYIVNVEDCTAKNYGYGFLNVNSNNDKTFVKNVTVTDANYGVKIDSSNGVVLENVDITVSVAGVLNSNYGPKTITVKNSTINIFGTWTRNSIVKTNIVFEGANTIDKFIIDENIDNFKLVPGATLAAPSGLTVTVDLANCEVVYEDGVYQVFDYVAFIKAELLAGRDVVLQKDIVVDGSHIESIPAKTNNFGQYFNPGIFNVVGDCDVTFDLNGHTITYNGHAIADYTATHNKDYYYNAATGKYEIHSCTVAHGLFMANDGAKLTIVGNGNVTVHGLASGVYSCSPDSVITVEGGNWYNDGCAVCGGTNIFLYASHGGELYINGGTFEQTLDANGDSYLIVEHGGNSSNSVIDYSKTKVVVSGGTFIGMNPENVVFIDQGKGQAFSKTNVVDDDYCADDLGNGVWGIANAVAKIEGVKGYETLDAAFAAAKPGDKVVLLENVNAASAIVMVPAGVIFDLNGCYLTAGNFLSFGDVIDTAEVVGGVVISNDTTKVFTILQAGNTYLPLYDSANGCYRFFKYSVEQKGSKVVNDDSVKFGFGLVFETRAAYELLKDEANSGIKFTLTMTVGEYEKNVVFDATHMLQPYSNTYYNNWYLIEAGTKKAPAITITAYNLSKLEGDADIAIRADVVSDTRVAGVSADNVFSYTVGTN